MRIRLFDIAKALLILSVYWYHIPQIYIGWLGGYNETMSLLNNINTCTFVPFFMTAFFFISGYFLNTEKKLGQAITHDALTIVLPAVLLSFVSNTLYSIYPGDFASRFHQYAVPSYWFTISLNFWFLFALFFNKCIVQLLVRYIHNRSVLLFVTICLSVLGLMLKNGQIDISNFFHYKEALLLCPVTVLGYLYKHESIEITRSHCAYFALGYVFTIILLWVSDTTIAGFNLGSGFSVDYYPMALWLGISGTMFVLYLSFLLEKSRILNYIGKLTLPLFCFNFFFIELFLRLSMPLMEQQRHVWLIIILIFIGSVVCAVLLSALLNTKYLRWILGRFPK